ncbi:MAG: hypothetical protein AAGD10_03840 [Myxococcota bacterium]
MRLGVSAGLFLFAACGNVVGVDGSVDPDNANALSLALDVDRARRRVGALPTPSVGSSAPQLVATSTPAVVRGRSFSIDLEFSPGEDGDLPRRVYFGVEGAEDYFLLDATAPLAVQVRVPSEVAEGRFSYHVCVDDEAGRVSNAVLASIDVIPPIIQREDGFFCSTGGESSCRGRGLQFCIEPDSRACFYVIEGERVGCACPEGSPTTSCVDRVVELCRD